MQAAALGVSVRPLEWLIYLLASILTATAVTMAGSVDFVGLVVPHMLRLVLGNDQRLILPACALAGGGLLVLADALAYADPDTITTLQPLGYWTEDLTGDGSTTTVVDLFEEIKVEGLDNDSNPNDVQASDLFSTVYAKDETTVSTSDGGGTRSAAGRVILIEGSRVYIQSGLANAGPTGASVGTSQSSGVATKTALAALPAASRHDGMLVMVRADGSLWRFVAAEATAEDEALELIIEPDAGTGRWLRADKAAVLKLPIDFNTADGAAILTVPAGFALRFAGLPFWEVTTAWTGGSSSAIGVSTDVTGYDTAGDILGGASGDVAAALTAGVRAGTIGDEMDLTGLQALALVEDDEIEFDRITSAFTAGAGFVCLPVQIMRVA